jgi:PhzF family phenazine biosynthesis protein
MRPPRSFAQVDVFAPRPGLGNPLAVIRADDALDPDEMQAMAAWLDLAETTFLLPPTVAGADYRLRIFTSRQEIAFAGHPSIGSAHAALSEGWLPRPANGVLMQECRAGVLPLRLEANSGVVTVRVPRSRIATQAPEHVALLRKALGDRKLAALAPALVEGGRRWWLAELADESQVRGMQPDFAAILALARASDSLGLCVFARGTDREHDLVVRAFPLGVGLQEDPASGAANAAIAAFLDEANALGELGRRYRVSQGREMGRDAELLLEIDAQDQVWVGGLSHTVVSGSLRW